MKQIELAKTGLRISAQCLGCMYFGTRTDRKTSFQILDSFVEAGGNFLDTANNYAFWITHQTGGDSESLLGDWMKDRGNRDTIVLATKVGAKPRAAGTGLENVEGLGAETIVRGIEHSLERLQTDRVDLYYAHLDDPRTPLAETLEAFDRLIQAGKVRVIGGSNLSRPRLEEAMEASAARRLAAYSCLQQEYTFLVPREVPTQYHSIVDPALQEWLRRHSDLLLVAYSPLLKGAYSQPERLPEAYQTEPNRRRLEVLSDLAKQTGATVNQLVLRWLTESTPAVVPVVGASSVAQLRENVGALSMPFERATFDAMAAARNDAL
jgi:aryl-alcohol dehydrogenase-like predicted oxidoreductase